jgi:hypothetical protein
MKRPESIFFGRDQGMAFFLAFLVLTTIVVPMVTLSQLGRVALSLIFVLTLIAGAFATIQQRTLIYLVVTLTICALTTDLIGEFAPSRGNSMLEIALKLACLSILVFMTLKRTLRPGTITGYRVIGGIAGYLLIGYVWAYAYQLVVLQAPNAIHFQSGVTGIPTRQPSHLMYFSFVTLTTVGYGDAYPVHPVVRSLAVAEALVGQLYLAILIASLVAMALHAKVTSLVGASVETGQPPDTRIPKQESEQVFNETDLLSAK